MSSIQDYLKEVSRILKTNGVFVVISLGSPEFRVSLLENNNLEVLQIKLLEATGKFDKLSENEMLRLKWNGQFHDKYVYVCSPVTA